MFHLVTQSSVNATPQAKGEGTEPPNKVLIEKRPHHLSWPFQFVLSHHNFHVEGWLSYEAAKGL